MHLAVQEHGVRRGVVAIVAALLAALLVVMGHALPANAASNPVTINFTNENNGTHNGLPVYNSEGQLGLEIGYGRMQDGEKVTVEMPEGLNLTSLKANLEGNDAVSSAVVEGGALVITFMTPFPSDIEQGFFRLNVNLNEWTHSEQVEFSFAVDGEPQKLNIIVKAPGDNFKNVVKSQGKAIGNVSWPAVDVKDGVVSLGDAYLTTELPFVVTLNTAEAGTFSIADVLDEGFAFVPGSFTEQVTSWDANGLNRVEGAAAPIAGYTGGSFAHDVELEANSEYTLRYTAKLADAAALAALQQTLQDAHDAAKGSVKDGDGYTFATKVGNSATIDGIKKRAESTIQKVVLGDVRPNIGNSFSKSATPKDATIEKPENGTLAAAVPVTYTLKADLTPYAAFAGTKYALERNIVIRDALPSQIEWLDDADNFLVASGIDLTRVDVAASMTQKAFAADEYAGKYAVVGKTLFVNVGKNVTTKAEIAVKAEITSVAGITAKTDGLAPAEAAKYSGPRNSAVFYLDPEDATQFNTRNVDHTLTVMKDAGSDVNDAQRFKKETGGEVQVKRGEVALVEYSFTVGTGMGEARDGKVVDAVDHSIFNVTDETLAQIRESITGTYGGKYALDGDTFDVTIDEQGNLILQPNQAFPKTANDGSVAQEPLIAGYTFTVTLPTYPIDGKQTLEIDNFASFQSDAVDYNYVSGASADATSYGNEMEVRKRLYDAKNDRFTPNLRVELDDNKQLVEDEFVYRVELIPHGQFTRMVLDVQDVLPESVQFLGFLGAAGLDGSLNGNNQALTNSDAVASYDEASGTVTIKKGLLQSGKTAELFFKVKVTDFDENVGIVNSIGSTSATIVPSNDYPLSLSKADAVDPENVISDSDAVFQVMQGEDVIVDDIFVENGQLRVKNAAGASAAVTVEEPGEYTVVEVRAPKGYQKTNDKFPLSITEEGVQTPSNVSIMNTPNDPTYAIGDVVWIDDNRDGVQGDGEFLEGVRVELLDVEGNLVEGVDPQFTDENGRYVFDELLAGTYRVQFTLTDDQAKLYKFTAQDAESDDANADSDADVVTGRTGDIVLGDDNGELIAAADYDYNDTIPVKASQGIDPTWDAGVIRKVVSVGDYVWFDRDRDGVQGDLADEPGIEGVVLEILDPQGKPVLDENGDPRAATTDKNGKYLFDGLPVIDADESYKVRIVQNDPSTEEALKSYAPTRSNDEGNGEEDSSIWEASSVKPLTEDGAEDLTLDFGFVLKTYAIGDVVWIDDNRDGVQGDGEFLEGVRVELLDVEGNLVEGVDPQFTDENGRYVFDELLAGTYRVQFTLTDDQAKLYKFTAQDAESDDANADSDADVVTGRTGDIVLGDDNGELIAAADYDYNDTIPVKASQGIDPTWDAGVIRKTYAIGDVVWIDANGDGQQDATENTLPGVKVTLVDAEGQVVATTVTDENGLYKFDELTGGTYQVRFELTDEQAKKYTFTKADQGADDSDSDVNPETGWTIKIVLDDTNQSLSTEYRHGDILATEGIDPTWDAGVVEKAVDPVEDDYPTGVDSENEVADDPSGVGNEGAVADSSEEPAPAVGPMLKDLPTTGSNSGLLWSVGAALLLLSGAVLLMVRRKARA